MKTARAGKPLCWLDAVQQGRLLRRGDTTSVELVQAHLDQIDRVNPMINAYLRVDGDVALKDAKALDTELKEGIYRSPLHGVTVAVKDLYDVEALPTTAGSPVGMGIAAADAHSIQLLRTCGAILIGKTNMHEWAYGVTNENGHFGAVRNPWNYEHVSGGSSGGSAAAVASFMAPLATGSDTGGSVRIPAAHCGVVGIKPTYGRISNQGLAPLAPSLDHPGVLARSVSDAALLLCAMSGYDPNDPVSKMKPALSWKIKALKGLGGIRVLIDSEYVLSGLDPAILKSFSKSIGLLEELGATVTDVTIIGLRAADDATLTILMAEAAAIHQSQMRLEPEVFGPDVRTRLEQGLEISGSELADAYFTARRIRRSFKNLFADYDVLVVPSTPVPAPRRGGDSLKRAGGSGSRAEALRSFARFTRFSNVLGVPAVSLPTGTNPEGLPLGVQLIGPPWREAHLLSIAKALEQVLGFEHRGVREQMSRMGGGPTVRDG